MTQDLVSIAIQYTEVAVVDVIIFI